MALLFAEFIPLIWFAVAGVIFIGIMMTLSVLTKPPGEKTPGKLATYECGEEPVQDPRGFQFNYQYFVYAIVFAALDIIAIFLYSWAVSGDTRFSLEALITVIFFVSILILGFSYVAVQTKDWKKNIM